MLKKLIILLITAMLAAGAAHAGFNRTAGLINIPSASMSLGEGEFDKGVSVLFASDTARLDLKLNYGINDKSEIGLTVHDIFGSPVTRANFQWQLLGGKKILVALGVQNIPLLGSVDYVPYSISPYMVSTLYISPAIALNIGAGGGRFRKDVPVTAYGLFAGVEFTLKSTRLGFEYDGNYLNLGIKYLLTPTIAIEGAAIRLNDTARGLAVCAAVSIKDIPSRTPSEEITGKLKEVEGMLNQLVKDYLENPPIAPPGGGTESGTIPGILPGGLAGGAKEEPGTIDNLAFEHAQAGTRYYFQGDYAKAVDEFKMAIALNGNIFIFHCQVGSVYYKLGMIDSAIAEWQRALEINPNDKNLKDFLLKVVESRMESEMTAQ